MTREEAITYLKVIWNRYKAEYEIERETLDAHEMAIEALTEPINCVKCKHYYETEDDTDVHGHCRMDTAHTNLISRADALRELNGACSNWKDDCKVAEIINALPSADAVEVVRCGECKYKRLYDDGDTKYYYCALEDRPNRNWSVDDTDYCSWGERNEII